MIPMNIDISGLLSQFSFSEKEVKDFSRLVLDMAANRYEKIWNDKIKNELNSTRSTYQESMKIIRPDDYSVIFELEGKGVGKLALMIEDGASAFDLKEGFKKSSKAKNPGQPNWYLTVPFRIATPEAIAESMAFSGRMTDPIYKIAKEKGKVSFNDLPQENRELGVRAKINVPETVMPKYKQEAYTHKSPIFEGITKGTKQYHGQYGTFRRVSDNSDKNSWIHKGFEKKDLMGRSLTELGGEIQEILNTARREFLDIKFE